MRTFIRILSLLAGILLNGTADLGAQVPATAVIEDGRSDRPAQVRINWHDGDEAAWTAQQGDRLDIMGVRTALGSERFGVAARAEIDFQLDLPSGHAAEMLVRIDRWTPGEQLDLVDALTGKTFFSLNQHSGHKALTPAFDPASTIFRWTRPDSEADPSVFIIDILYVHPDRRDGRGIGFNMALPCHPNAACFGDSLHEAIANSTVRIRMVMDEGIGWCSGALVNTARQDKTPYLLSAYHCQYDFTPQYDLWRFDFTYASPACENPAVEPSTFSLTGCSLTALGQETDFLLVLLDDPIPANLPATFAGWDRSDTAVPDTSYLIHHPSADIRKISTAENATTIHPSALSWTEGYSTPANHHFRIRFTEGGHQPGSSGGPVFNQAGYLVGQLHGGTAGCEMASNTYAGRLSRSWSLGPTPAGRLRDWLDPDGTAVMSLAGIPNINSSDIVTVDGKVVDPIGRPVRHATITVSGDESRTLTTGEDGAFRLENINRLGTYTLTPQKDDNPKNGLNVLDMVAIQKHLLGKDTLDHAWQYVAADATNNNAVAAGDILLILRLLIGKIDIFPTSPSWRFDPPVIELSELPQGGPNPVSFTAIKIGDVNHSANPQD
jgi:hypothetical protein